MENPHAPRDSEKSIKRPLPVPPGPTTRTYLVSHALVRRRTSYAVMHPLVTPPSSPRCRRYTANLALAPLPTPSPGSNQTRCGGGTRFLPRSPRGMGKASEQAGRQSCQSVILFQATKSWQVDERVERSCLGPRKRLWNRNWYGRRAPRKAGKQVGASLRHVQTSRNP